MQKNSCIFLRAGELYIFGSMINKYSMISFVPLTLRKVLLTFNYTCTYVSTTYIYCHSQGLIYCFWYRDF